MLITYYFAFSVLYIEQNIVNLLNIFLIRSLIPDMSQKLG